MMKFCCECAGELALQIPEGDKQHRYVCTQCKIIHYQNPQIISNCLIYQDQQVLLCQRTMQPHKGLWSIPGGYIEIGETSRKAAARKALAETQSDFTMQELFAVVNSPDAGYINLIYLAQLQQLEQQIPQQSDTLDAMNTMQLFSQHEVPWDKIAFFTVKKTLSLYFEDLNSGQLNLHEIDL